MRNIGTVRQRCGLLALGSAGALLCGVVAFVAPSAGRTEAVASAVAPVPTDAELSALATPEGRVKFVDRFCTGCHDDIQRSGGLVLDGLSPHDLADNATIWEDVVRRLTAGDMPPFTEKLRPHPQLSQAMVRYLTADLDAAAVQSPFAGRSAVSRLNRTEYGNAVSDLLGIEFPYHRELPADGGAAGFDNIADALSFSPVLLETYMRVGRKATELALGEADPGPVTESFPATRTQAEWQGPGMPFGTRGGIRITRNFPRTGEYDLRALLTPVALTPTEGVRLFQTRLKVTAGVHNVIITFPQSSALSEGPVPNLASAGGPALGGPLDAMGSASRPRIMFFMDGKLIKTFEVKGPSASEAALGAHGGPPALARAEIRGPFKTVSKVDTPSREQILSCRPKLRSQEAACANSILSRLLRRAWRRDVTAQDVKPFLATFRKARGKSAFPASIGFAVRDILVSPQFLFRLELDPQTAEPGKLYQLSNFELASRLSFFLWSTIPDEQLLNAASRGELQDPAQLQRQVQRMIASPRSNALIDNFAMQWLGVKNGPHPLDGFVPADPAYDVALGDAFRTELQMFLRSIMREDRSILDVLNANYTFVNERLARNYGIPGIRGAGFRRVTLPVNSPRGGILGMGAILMPNSHTTSTSPVYRGEWVLTSLLNSPPQPPPNNVPPLDSAPVNGRVLTLREQTERHRADPVCASCHVRMDPYGFALENFDVLGRWRTKDGASPVDASTMLPSGERFTGPQGLRKVLVQHSAVYANATTAKMLTYAIGRRLTGRDMPTVRRIVAETAPHYRFGDIVLAVARSTQFTHRQVERPAT